MCSLYSHHSFRKLEVLLLCLALASHLVLEAEPANLNSFVEHGTVKKAQNDGPAIRRMQQEADAAAKLKIPKVGPSTEARTMYSHVCIVGP